MSFIERLRRAFTDKAVMPDILKISGHLHKGCHKGGYSLPLLWQIFTLITDIMSEAELTLNGNKVSAREFSKWFQDNLEKTLWQLYEYGFTAVTWSNGSFVTIENKWLSCDSDGRVVLPASIVWRGVTYTVDPRFTYCLTSECFDVFRLSDFALLMPYLRLLDTAFGNTQAALDSGGKVLMISPDAGDSHMSSYLDPVMKKEFEESFTKNYVEGDSIVSTFFSNMPATVHEIDLTRLGEDTMGTVKDLICILCGHFKVPAVCLPLLDANGSHGLSNGGEILSSNLLLYATAKRMMKYVERIAEAFGLTMDYTLPNEPSVEKEP